MGLTTDPIARFRQYLELIRQSGDDNSVARPTVAEFVACAREVANLRSEAAVAALESPLKERNFPWYAEESWAVREALKNCTSVSQTPLSRCAALLQRQEQWAASFEGSPVDNLEFSDCFAKVAALGTPDANQILRSASASSVLFPKARAAARQAAGLNDPPANPKSSGASAGEPDYGQDQERFLNQAEALLQRLPARELGTVLEGFWQLEGKELQRPENANSVAEAMVLIRRWAKRELGKASFRGFRIQYHLDDARDDGGRVTMIAFHQGEGGLYYLDCHAKPTHQGWLFWF